MRPSSIRMTLSITRSSILSAIFMAPYRHLEETWLKSKCAKNIIRYRQV